MAKALGHVAADRFFDCAVAALLGMAGGAHHDQVERMLLMSADDIETPGWDFFTGAGRLNAVKALQADPDWHLTAQVKQVVPVREGGRTVIQVRGTVIGSNLASYRLELARGEAPTSWKRVGPEGTGAVEDGLLGTIPIREITAPPDWPKPGTTHQESTSAANWIKTTWPKPAA